MDVNLLLEGFKILVESYYGGEFSIDKLTGIISYKGIKVGIRCVRFPTNSTYHREGATVILHTTVGRMPYTSRVDLDISMKKGLDHYLDIIYYSIIEEYPVIYDRLVFKVYREFDGLCVGDSTYSYIKIPLNRVIEYPRLELGIKLYWDWSCGVHTSMTVNGVSENYRIVNKVTMYNVNQTVNKLKEDVIRLLQKYREITTPKLALRNVIKALKL